MAMSCAAAPCATADDVLSSGHCNTMLRMGVQDALLIGSITSAGERNALL